MMHRKYSPIILLVFILLALSFPNPASAEELTQEEIDLIHEVVTETYTGSYYSAYGLIKALGPDAIPYLIDELKYAGATDTLTGNVSGMLHSIGPDAIPPLIEALSNPDDWIRSGAAYCFYYFKEEAIDAVPYLLPILDDEMVEARRNAALVLGEIGLGCEEVIGKLSDALSDDDSEVRLNAIYSIQDLKEHAESATDALCEVLTQDEDTDVQSAAALCLAKIGAPAEKVIPGYIAALKKSGMNSQRTIIRAISYYGEEAASAVPAMLELTTNDYGWEFKRSLVVAFGNIGPSAALAIPWIEDYAENYPGSGMIYCYLGPREGFNPYPGDSAYLAMAKIEGGDSMIELLQHENSSVRYLALLQLLAGPEDERLINLVIGMLEDEYYLTRIIAIEALAEWQEYSELTIPLILDISLNDDHKYYGYREGADYGPDYFGTGEYPVRDVALVALEKLGYKSEDS